MAQSPCFLFPLADSLLPPILVPFTYLETLLAVIGSVHLGLRLLINWPPLFQPFPFPPHSKFPVPRLNMRLTTTTSRIRLLLSGTSMVNTALQLLLSCNGPPNRHAGERTAIGGCAAAGSWRRGESCSAESAGRSRPRLPHPGKTVSDISRNKQAAKRQASRGGKCWAGGKNVFSEFFKDHWSINTCEDIANQALSIQSWNGRLSQKWRKCWIDA